jgi:thiol-disulfide isomerase/thioredoxin
VDAAGQPVVGASVGTAFQLAATRAKTRVIIGYNQPPVTTDSRGSFNIPASLVAYSHVLVAAAPDGAMGFAIKGPDAPVQIRILTPTDLQVTLMRKAGIQKPVAVELAAGGSAVGYGDISGGSAEFIAPQGSMELKLATSEASAVTRALTLSAGGTARVQIDLQPPPWLQLVGKPAPAFTPTDVHNWTSGGPLTLRGKWVLVDFWATWCQPCVQEMPKLVAFYEQNAPARDRFEIVAVHSADGESFQAIRGAYDRLVARAWGGKTLPFPLLFDSTGETQKRWGIELLPMSLLVDPEGRVAGVGTVEDLAAKVRPRPRGKPRDRSLP